MNETIPAASPAAYGVARLSMPEALTLRAWRVFETQADGWHLVGFCAEQGKHCVTSAVQQFDASKAIAVTASSRYRLVGAPRVDVRVLGAWTRWAREHNAMRAHDITDGIWSAICARTNGFGAIHDSYA